MSGQPLTKGEREVLVVGNEGSVFPDKIRQHYEATCVALETELQQLREQLEHATNRADTLNIDAGRRHVENLALTAQLTEAQASKAKLAQLNESLSNSNDECWLENAKLTAQLQSARDALKRYGEHDGARSGAYDSDAGDCPKAWNRDATECTCGLDAALAQLSGEGP